MTEVYARHSMFEGMFVKGITPSPALREQLKKNGFDLDRELPRYPVSVWIACVDSASRELYPQASLSEGWRELGRTFIRGYLSTIVGRVIGTTFPFLSGKSFVTRSPRFMSTGLENCATTLTWQTPKRARLEIAGGGPNAGYLMAGVFDVCFPRMNVTHVVMEPFSGPGLDASLEIELPKV